MENVEAENALKVIGEVVGNNISVNYIKLVKNTKGYGWEIKVIHNDVVALEELNNQMVQKFGEEI